MIEKPLIMRDNKHRTMRRAQRRYPIADYTQSVNVQATVSFIENRKYRLKDRHL